MKIDWKKEIKLPRPSLSWLRRGPSLPVKKPSLKAPSLKKRSAAAAPRTAASKRPSLKGPSMKRPKALSAGPSIKLPRPVTDIYADLRDRHLLPLVALLIVAIVAAPILLNKSSDSKTPPPVAATGVSGTATSTSSFTVVPAARTLRSPGQRLGHRQPLDPFRVEQKKAKAHGSDSGTQGGNAGTQASDSAGGGTVTETVPSTVPAESVPIETATAPTETQPPRHSEIKIQETAKGDKAGSAGGSPGTAPESTSTTTEVGGAQTEVVGYTVDLKTGDPEGELAEVNEVAPMTKLPTAKNPLLVFVGLSQDNKRGLFLMTSKVTAYYGAVHCVVDAQACQLVELKPGHAALFEYISGETEAKYKVVLEKIEPVERPAEAQPQQSSPRADALGVARRFSK